MEIRDFEPSADRAAVVAFVREAQIFEHTFELDRRLDDTVADEYFEDLFERTARKRGRIFVAEDGGRVIGWAVFVVEENPLFVIEAERVYGYIAELFVDEGARGLGVGRALISVCEDHTRDLGLGHIRIGVLADNARAAAVYARAGFTPYHIDLRKYL